MCIGSNDSELCAELQGQWQISRNSSITKLNFNQPKPTKYFATVSTFNYGD